MTLISAIITLFLVMDSMGNVPVFLSLLKDIAPKRRLYIITREMIFSFLILVVFLLFGDDVLKSLNLSASALQISGGVILFIIAIRMIFPMKDKSNDELEGEPFIVPLAIPLMAGPSSIATVIIFSTQEPDRMGVWFLAVFIASLASLLLLLCSNILMKLLGKKGLYAMERLMGMMLTTIAVQMFLDGLKLFFQH